MSILILNITSKNESLKSKLNYVAINAINLFIPNINDSKENIADEKSKIKNDKILMGKIRLHQEKRFNEC